MKIIRSKKHWQQILLAVYNSLRILFHFIVAVQFWYAIYYDYAYVTFPPSKTRLGSTFGGKFKYLTFLDAIIQASYFTICLVNDVVGTNEIGIYGLPMIRKVRDFIYASLAFPIALNVGVTFWTLMAIDRELVFPKVLDTIFPSWLNHIMHTNIVVFIILDMFISFRAYPDRKSCILTLAVFMIAYLVWIHIIRYSSGFWVYPVLEVLNLPQRIGFYLVVLGFTLSLYYLGEWMNRKIWVKELKTAYRKRT